MKLLFLLLLLVAPSQGAGVLWGKDDSRNEGGTPIFKPDKPVDIRETLVDIADDYLYVRESNGPNRSKDIDAWNRATSVPLGSPYCASFQAFVHTKAGVKGHPNSAWSPSWFSSKRLVSTSDLGKGDVVGLYYSRLGRVGHILMVDEIKSNTVVTVEANTSPQAKPGSNSDRDGDGVHRKYRSKALIFGYRNKHARHWSR